MPLHVSQVRIQTERANLVLRTKNRIASLNAAAQKGRIANFNVTETETKISIAALTLFVSVCCYCFLTFSFFNGSI